MALGDSYVTQAELKTYLKITTTAYDTQVDDARSVASRAIDKYCRRQFNAAGSATARVFYPATCRRAEVYDVSTTTGLVVKTDTGDDGTYETTWTSSDYQLEPLDGVADGETGWPYTQLRAVGSYLFPTSGYRAPLQVTANWGWPAVPAAVKQACYLLAKDHFGLREVKFGAAQGGGEFGPIFVRANRQAAELLTPYVRDRLLVA